MRTWQLEVINEDEKVDQKEDTPGNFKRAQFQYQWIKKSPWDTSMQLLIIFATSAFFFYHTAAQAKHDVEDVLFAKLHSFVKKVLPPSKSTWK